jgi:hypothetical protein
MAPPSIAFQMSKSGEGTPSRSRGRNARGMHRCEALEQGGRGEHRALAAPAASRTKVESTRVSHRRYAEAIRRSPRDGLRLIPRSPRSAGLDSLRRPQSSCELDPSVGGSGPRGFARPRWCRTPGGTCTSIASRSNVCGDWPNAPPGGSGTGGYNHKLRKNGGRIFLPWRLDTSGKSVRRAD